VCDVHGPKRQRKKHNPNADGNIEKAEPVFSPNSVAAVTIQSPTVIGTDPFGSLQAEQTAKALKNFKEKGTVAPIDNKIPVPDKPEPDAPEIPKAIPVLPGQSTTSPLPTPKDSPAPTLPKLDF